MKKKFMGELSRKVFITCLLSLMAIFVFCLKVEASSEIITENGSPEAISGQTDMTGTVSYPTNQQQRTITGTVVDASTNETLPGVNISIEGTNVGVITNENGKYSISVESETAVLSFSFVGYKTERVETAGKTEINVSLVPEATALQEVVVVGYGTMQKLDVSGSIVSTNSDVIREVPSTSALQALQGRLPGIQISQTSTRPGASMQIRVRGERSINATNNPLIVVDGIPFEGSLNDISPTDIKSVDILKDASATAIYGSRGANGVILITTFRGIPNGVPAISYNGYYGVRTVAKKYPVYNGEEFQAFRHATLNTDYKDQYTALEQASIAAGTSTDWQDLMYSNARVTNHDLSVITGTDKGAYSFGGGYYNETAVLPGLEYTRFSLRTTLDQQVGQYIRVGLTSQNSYSIRDGEGFATEGTSNGLMNNILTLSPLLPAYNEDGTIREIPTEGWVDTYYNPLLLKDKSLWQERRKRLATFNSVFGEIRFNEHLRYRINLGLSFYTENYGRYYASNTPIQNGAVSAALNQSINDRVWTVENLLYYDNVFAEKHRVGFTALYSAERSEYTKSQMNAQDLPANYIFFYNLALANGAKTIDALDANGDPLQAYLQRGLLSYMVRAQYAYSDRYLLTVTFRSDGSSVLASGHQWHNYPALSAGWVINRESFLRNVEAIDLLKLRLGYGQTSNQAIAPYETLGELKQIAYNFGSTNQYGYYVSKLPNPNLGWEYTTNYNIGIDFGFLNNRLSGYFDYYYQKTKDVLVKVQLPQSSGVLDPMYQNVGTTENRGFEFNLSAQIIKPTEENGFGWDMDFNIYTNHNKIISLNSGVSEDIGNGLFVGHPINVIYDYVKLGIIQESEAPYFGYSAGKIKVQDLSGPDGVPDGTITAAYDRKIVGTYEPDFEGGLSTRFYYKNFDLSAVSFFRSGGTLVSTIYMPQSYLNTNNARRNSIKVDYWTPEHTSGTYPEPGNQSTADVNDFGTTLGYFKASFLKVRTISLGYTFEPKVLSYIGGKKARIYFTAQNPFIMFSPYVKAGGVDPETTGTGSQAANTGLKAGSGITDRVLTVGANAPPTRNFLVGLSVTF